MLYGFEIETAMVNVLQLQGYGNVQFQDALAYTGDTMKFDVVIGNPPYQSTADGSKRKKLWVQFALLALQKARFAAMVTPNTWKLGSKYFREIKDILTTYWIAEGDANFYFPAIGENIGWWIADKETSSPLDPPKLSIAYTIFRKVAAEKKGNWHYRDFQTPETLETKTTEDHTYPVYWTAKQTRYAIPSAVLYRGWKVIVNNSGGYHDNRNPDKYNLVCNDRGVGFGAWRIKVSSKVCGENVLSWVRSSLYRVLVLQTKTGGFNNPFIELPYLGEDKLWTDEEIYAHFNLTAEEIAYIEETVK